MKTTPLLSSPFTRAIGILTLLFAPILPCANAGKIDLPAYGFEIEALDAEPGGRPTTAIMTFLPATDGFAPNVNVNIQPYQGSVKNYAVLSKGQFEQMHFKIVAEQEKGGDEWSVEYTGEQQGAALHFYARAVSKNGRVFLVTATAKESQWAAVGAKLRKHVDSLKLK